MQQHVDSLLQVVGRTHEATSGAGSSRGDKEAKVSKLSDEDDIEVYLTTFERMMVAYGVPKDRWVFREAPQLTRKVQQAYAAMAAEDTGDYGQLKVAIFQRYSITVETYRVRLRSVACAREESYAEMATRVMDLARKWTRKREVFAVEQLLNSDSRALDLGERNEAQDGGRGWQASRLLRRGQGSPGRPESAGSSQGAL